MLARMIPARHPPGAAIMADYAPLVKTSDGYVAVHVILVRATRSCAPSKR